MKTEEAKEKICPILTVAAAKFGQKSNCQTTDCMWWQGDDQHGTCAIGEIHKSVWRKG